MEPLDADEMLGVLTAWDLVRSEGWPSLCPTMSSHRATWGSMGARELLGELRGYLREMNAPTCQARVFWKRAPNYPYLGCNDAFARDAGLKSAEQMVGLDDLSPSIAWGQQGAKYRADDERVVASRTPLLGILERQTRLGEVVFVLTNKAPLLVRGGGKAFGILGMYEALDPARARALHHAKARGGTA